MNANGDRYIHVLQDDIELVEINVDTGLMKFKTSEFTIGELIEMMNDVAKITSLISDVDNKQIEIAELIEELERKYS